MGSVKIQTNDFWEEITKKRYLEQKNNHLFLRVDENNDKYGHFYIDDIKDLESYDAVVVSDYNKRLFNRKRYRKYIK